MVGEPAKGMPHPGLLWPWRAWEGDLSQLEGGLASWLHLPRRVPLGKWRHHSGPPCPHISDEHNHSAHLTGLWRELGELINVKSFLGSGMRLALSVWEPIAGLESQPCHLPTVTGRPLSEPWFLPSRSGSDDLYPVILLGGGLCLHPDRDR